MQATPTIAVLGGGIGGLSAAHELAERGFDVAVYEAEARFGGKARSVPADDGDPPLPGEHGFRFFPGFYRHVTDTMARIPYGDGSVSDNLVATSTMLMAETGGEGRTMPTETPSTLGGWREVIGSMFARDRVPAAENRFFVERLLTLLTSCEARFREEYERRSWWEFIEAERMSEAYKKYLGYGITQSLVAMRPEVSSTRTIGRIYLQMIRGLFDPSIDADRLLNGPTNEVWIDPWVEHLRDLGVEFHPETRLRALRSDGERVTAAVVEGPEGRREIRADHYVAAVPVEAMVDLVDGNDALARAAPSLDRLDGLETAWMNGIQFYLREDVPTVRGHGVCYDSPWALTTVSQRQFWSEYDLSACADGEVEGVLSVCISDWETPGVVYGKPAKACTREEIKDEVWEQLKRHFGDELRDDNRHGWFLDPAIEETDEGVRNTAPLLINTVGSLRYRPEARTAADNLVLAADYVRTESDLASMESANEAARRATNAILERTGVEAEPCETWGLDLPAFLGPIRRQDELRYRLGLPHPGEVGRSVRRVARALGG